MVAYNFKEQFALMVASGQKRQTIRALRKRHVMPGEAIQLYTGSRKLVDSDPICTDVIDISIDDNGVYQPYQGRMDHDQIAMDDGFSDFAEMKAFFQEAYGLPFLGVLIKWEL